MVSWIPKEACCITLGSARRLGLCDMLLKRNANDPFFKEMVTGDKKWIVYDNLLRKRSCWSRQGKQAPKKDTLISLVALQRLSLLRAAAPPTKSDHKFSGHSKKTIKIISLQTFRFSFSIKFSRKHFKIMIKKYDKAKLFF